MADGLKELTLKIGEAAQGSKSAVAAFEGYGVSIRDANGDVRDAGKLLPDIADAFAKLKSPAEQAAFAAQIFGEDVGPKMVPLLAKGSRAIGEYRAAAQELGVVLSDAAIEKAGEAQKKMAELNLVLEAKIAGAVSENADAIVELADALAKLVEYAGKAAKAWRYFSNLDWSPGAGSFTEQFKRMQMKELGPGVELTDSVKAAIAARKAAPFLKPAGGSLLTAPPKSSTQPTTQTPWGPILPRPGITRALGGLNLGGTDLSKFMPGSGSSDWMTAANDTYGNLAKLAGEIAEKDKEAMKALAEMASVHGPRLEASLKKLTPEMESLRGATQDILDRLFPDEAEARRYSDEIGVLTAAMNQGQLSSENYAKAITALRQEFNGFSDAMAEAIKIMPVTVGPSLEELNAAILANLPAAFKKVGDDAEVMRVRVEESFASMAASIGDLIGQLIGGKTGRIIGGVIGIVGKALPLFGVPGFANGTSFAPGGLAWVGERGPELIDLPRGARVTPNNDVGSRLGGTIQVVPSPYFNVIVDGRIMQAAPAIADGASKVTMSRLAYKQTRRFA
jgi:hypothetical protein